MTPAPPRLAPPGEDQGQFDPMSAGPGGPPISPAPQQPDQNAMAAGWILDIVRTARLLGSRYPAAMPEVRDILAAVARVQPKIIASAPAPEPMAPPI